jgi:hypothetical protein
MSDKAFTGLLHDLSNKICIAQGKVNLLVNRDPGNKDLESLNLTINRAVDLLTAIKLFF